MAEVLRMWLNRLSPPDPPLKEVAEFEKLAEQVKKKSRAVARNPLAEMAEGSRRGRRAPKKRG